MASAALLAEPQLRQFREAGYVVVPRLVGEELLRSYREQFWSLPEIDADPDDRGTWPEAPPCASRIPLPALPLWPASDPERELC